MTTLITQSLLRTYLVSVFYMPKHNGFICIHWCIFGLKDVKKTNDTLLIVEKTHEIMFGICLVTLRVSTTSKAKAPFSAVFQ